MLSPEQLEFLKALVPPDSLSAGDSARSLHSRDQSSHEAHLPDVVMWPETTDQVSRSLAYAQRERIAVTGLYSVACALSVSAFICRRGVTSNTHRLRPCVAATISPVVGCCDNSWIATVGRLLLSFVHTPPRSLRMLEARGSVKRLISVYFSGFARQITILVRGNGLAATMSQYLIDQIEATPNIRVEPRTQVVSVAGNEHLECITVECADNQRQIRQTNSLFGFIGAAPRTDFLGDTVMGDKNGFIWTGADLIVNGKRPAGWPLERDPYLLETSVPGIFAVGDVRHGSIKRVASGVGEGSMAIAFVHQYLAELKAEAPTRT